MVALTWGELKRQAKKDRVKDNAVIKIAVDFRSDVADATVVYDEDENTLEISNA